MSTTLVKPAEVERKWYLLDAAGKSLGHVAAEAAVLLRGKQKVDYTPNVTRIPRSSTIGFANPNVCP